MKEKKLINNLTLYYHNNKNTMSISISSQKCTFVQTDRDFAISVLKQNYPEYKKFPFILPELFILFVEFLCKIQQKWYKNDQLKCRTLYVNNKRHGECKGWYSTGELYYQYFYVNGKSHGIDKLWYKNGKILSQQSYVNGKSHGENKAWYENGQIAYQYHFVNNKMRECKDWSENGKLKYRTRYVKGELITL